MSDNKQVYGPAIRLAVISLVICGLLFPILVTGLAQIIFPYQANGEIVQFHGHAVGSLLIAQNFTSPVFFQPRNASDSASGVDPDITLQDAYSQIPRIHNTTGISIDALKQLVDANVERTIWITGEPYVNVLRLNLILIDKYPSTFQLFG
ncbi:MAG: potassium-transporting ATPase subunit C [Candidatus Bathyarchaeia archaeon]|jgi:K+-transporting ATPase ATPase C chain